VAVTDLDALYTSAPILDYDEEAAEPFGDEEHDDVPGDATLAPEAFDAQILAGLIAP
jgi:hypothetical protein